MCGFLLMSITIFSLRVINGFIATIRNGFHDISSYSTTACHYVLFFGIKGAFLRKDCLLCPRNYTKSVYIYNTLDYT